MTISVRPATEADVAPICAVGRSAWPRTYAFAGREYVEHGLVTWWTDEAVPAARGAVGIEYIDGNDRPPPSMPAEVSSRYDVTRPTSRAGRTRCGPS